MKEDVNPMVAVGAVLALIVIIAGIMFFRGHMGVDPQAAQKNQQIIGQMKAASATSPGAAQPQPGGGMMAPPAPGGMAPAPPGGMAPAPPGGK
jgi:hypothetical protein